MSDHSIPFDRGSKRLLSDENIDRVTTLIASIIPSSSREQIKSKFVYNWDQKAKKRINRRKKKKPNNDQFLRSLALPRLGLAYADMLPIHNLWLQYMENILSDYLGKEIPAVYDPGHDNFSLLLMKADYNGAKVKVVRSKCSSLIGKTGIIAMETKETLKIVQENNHLISEFRENRVFRKHFLIEISFSSDSKERVRV